MRIANTLIGIAAGLVVSYVVLPVRGRDAIAAGTRRALAAIADLLETIGRAGPAPVPAQYTAVLDSLLDLEKAARDAGRELGGEAGALRQAARQAELACVATIAAGIAHVELRGSPGGLGAAGALCKQATRLAARARSGRPDATARDRAAAAAELPAPDEAAAVPDAVALHGLALALRKVEHALGALGR
jgi:hypothetical protein